MYTPTQLITMGFLLIGAAVWLSDRLKPRVLYWMVLASMGLIALGGLLALVR